MSNEILNTNYDLALVLPCYNPIAGWSQKVIEQVKALEERLVGERLLLILVNDGSTKGVDQADISALASALQHFQYIDEKENRGKGYAIRKGMVMAPAPICLYTDIDFPYELDSIYAIYETLKKGQADIVIGIKNEQYYENVPAHRIRISRFLKWLTRTFLHLSITDTQCGLKGFNQKGKLILLETQINRYLFDLELVYLADRYSSIQMKSIPIQLRDGVSFSKVNWRILWQEGWNFMQILWKRRT